MYSRGMRLGAGLACALWSQSLVADSLNASDRLLCSASEAFICAPGSPCENALPSSLQIPQFLIVDLGRKTLATTEASGHNRATPILSLAREDGHIFLQGVQMGRAFSMVLREDSGQASIAIATDGLALGVFGACTPSPTR